MGTSRFFMNSIHRNDTNHTNYYYFVSAFTPTEILRIKELGDSMPKQRAVTGSGDVIEESDYRVSEISWIPEIKESQWIYNKIADYAAIANKEMWNFDIWGFPDDLQYTTYFGDGGHYDWHVDLGPGMSNRKMSAVLQLSTAEEYDGGELQINVGSSIMNVQKELGVLCFFPSFLLHRVTPVVSGVRQSLVTWLGGNNLR